MPRKIFKVTWIRTFTKIKSDRWIGPKNTTYRRICIPLFTPLLNTTVEVLSSSSKSVCNGIDPHTTDVRELAGKTWVTKLQNAPCNDAKSTTLKMQVARETKFHIVHTYVVVRSLPF